MQTNRTQLRIVACRLLCVTALVTAVPQAFSQTGGLYDLTWNTTDGGGSTSAAGGAYNLGGTIGQSDAGASNGGAYALAGGFWGGANVTAPAGPVPSQVVSRKLHGGTPFDINLPLTGNSGIECRTGGASNDYQVVATFGGAVTYAGASVSSGAGSVSTANGSGTNSVTVNLTGITSGQTIMVTLSSVSDGVSTGDVSIPMAILVGDTNGNRAVTASDIGQVKGQSGQAVSAANFRTDVTANGGSVNASDIGLVKSKSGTQLPLGPTEKSEPPGAL